MIYRSVGVAKARIQDLLADDKDFRRLHSRLNNRKRKEQKHTKKQQQKKRLTPGRSGGVFGQNRSGQIPLRGQRLGRPRRFLPDDLRPAAGRRARSRTPQARARATHMAPMAHGPWATLLTGGQSKQKLVKKPSSEARPCDQIPEEPFWTRPSLMQLLRALLQHLPHQHLPHQQKRSHRCRGCKPNFMLLALEGCVFFHWTPQNVGFPLGFPLKPQTWGILKERQTRKHHKSSVLKSVLPCDMRRRRPLF